jgi:hypothetical protein
MTNRLWNALARLLATPVIADALIRLAMRRPYRHIGDYMHRYWLVPESWGLPFAIRINHIRKPDADPYLHDHPWNWRTVILNGWYTEELDDGEQKFRWVGDTRAGNAHELHRIIRVADEGVWTLFITGKRFNHWGFMVGDPARKISHQDYVSPNGRTGMTANTQHSGYVR